MATKYYFAGARRIAMRKASTLYYLGNDPLSGSAGAPQSQNRYAYALNNPAGLVDPSGLAATGGSFVPPPGRPEIPHCAYRDYKCFYTYLRALVDYVYHVFLPALDAFLDAQSDALRLLQQAASAVRQAATQIEDALKSAWDFIKNHKECVAFAIGLGGVIAGALAGGWVAVLILGTTTGATVTLDIFTGSSSDAPSDGALSVFPVGLAWWVKKVVSADRRVDPATVKVSVTVIRRPLILGSLALSGTQCLAFRSLI